MTKPNALHPSMLVLSLHACLHLSSLANAAPLTTQVPQLTLDEAAAQCQKALNTEECPPEVLPICQKAADLAELTLGKMSEKTAKMLLKLGECYYCRGKYTDAELATRKSLAIRQNLFGQTHVSVGEALNNLALFLLTRGSYKEAETVFRQALEIFSSLFGSEHAFMAGAMNGLALALDRQGKYGLAENMERQALSIHINTLGDKHSYVGDDLLNLSLILKHLGKYQGAEQLARQSLKLKMELFGEKHPDVSRCLNTLGSILDKEGKYDEAEAVYQKALAMTIEAQGEQHPSVAIRLTGLAWVRGHRGKHAEAIGLLQQALAIDRQSLPSMSHNMAITIHNIAAQRFSLGEYTEAELQYREALSIFRNNLGNEHPLVVQTVHNLAATLLAQGRYPEAEELFRQSLELGKTVLGQDHPNVAFGLFHLALIQINRNKPSLAAALLGESLAIREKQIRSSSSEARVHALIESFRKDEDFTYAFLIGQVLPEIATVAIRQVLLRKGRAAEAGALANRLIHRNLGRPELKQRFDEWVSVRQQREFLLLGGMGKRKPEEYQKQLQDLQIRAESLEHTLAVEVPEIRDVQPPPFDEIVAKVAQRLPSDGVLLEVVEANPYQGGRPDAHLRASAHFIALLLFPDQRVVSVDLGEAKMINALTESFRRALASSHSQPEAAAQALYAVLFDRLRDHLGGRKEIYLSLEGSLNLVPFDALHDGSDYLLGRYRFHYLTSGRDLLRKPSNQPVGPAVVLGNPYFGPEWISATADGSNFFAKLAPLVNLPWAQQEVEVVAKLLGVRPLLGTEAKEDVLHGRLAPWVLHLATHGIYLSDLSAWQIPGVDRSALLPLQMPGQGPDPNAPPPQRLPGEFGPMNRSGLLFAGVRQGMSVEDKTKDGLLTAEEARSLDLDGAQLVVLSACDSGMGETAPGQGVYGLRRAFLIAGAETLVTSLWRVDDEATGELMAMYYQKLLDKQSPGNRLGAMIESMQALRTRPGRSHPYYWAPFLVIGADGPLRTLRQ